LQIIIWLECLRIHKETNTKLPSVTLCSKKKSKDLYEHFDNSIQLLFDKLVIWNLTSDENELNIQKDFAELIVKEL
jgi:hypothetical protein